MAREVMQLQGLDGVLKTLESLPPELVSRNGGPVRAALRKAAVLIQRQAQANVQRIVDKPNIGGAPTKSTGALKDSITVRRIRPPRGGKGERFWVGIAPLKRKYANTKYNVRKQRVGKEYTILPPTYYAWFLEFGTENMRAHPFMRLAYRARRQQALQVFSTELPRAIDRIARKLARQNGVA